MTNQAQQSSVLGSNEPERVQDKKRCPRCGGMVYVERLSDSGPGQKFLEWTCMICGWTHYPNTPKVSEPRTSRRKAIF